MSSTPEDEDGAAGKMAALYSEKKSVSSQISTLVRYIAFGLVAVTYSLFTSTAEFANTILREYKTLLLFATSFGGLTILIDYLQYAFGYYNVNKALGRETKEYNKNWWTYKGRDFCFKAKQCTVLLGLILFCITMFGSALIEKRESPPTITVPNSEIGK